MHPEIILCVISTMVNFAQKGSKNVLLAPSFYYFWLSFQSEWFYQIKPLNPSQMNDWGY